MPARTAEARLSTASGQTSANSRCRRRARPRRRRPGGRRRSAPKASATGGVRETTWTTKAVATPEPTQRSASPVSDTSPSPASAEQPGQRARLGSGPARSAGGSANADQTSSSPTPTPSPTSAPIRPPTSWPARMRWTSMPRRSNAPSRGGIPPVATSSPPCRTKIGSVSITSFSTRPGTPTISSTRRTPCSSMPEVHDEVDRWPRRSGPRTGRRCSRPASSGSVHIFTSASRALLAWIVHMPGSPALSASSRSRHSSARTSPTMIRVGRIRRLSLTRSRSAISPVPSRPGCRVCIATQSGWGNRSSKTSSALTTRSPPGMAAARQFSIVVLPAWVPPATRMLSPARTRRLEERRRARA